MLLIIYSIKTISLCKFFFILFYFLICFIMGMYMTKVLIAGFHSCNRGDESALRGLVASIKELVPDAEFTVLDSHPRITATIFSSGYITFLRWVINYDLQPRSRSKNRFLNLALNILHFTSWLLKVSFDSIKCMLWAIFWKYNVDMWLSIDTETLQVLQEFVNADLVLLSPAGPYFGDLYPFGSLTHLLHLQLSVILGKPLMICAPSAGPFRKYQRFVYRYFLEKVHLITVRDSVSKIFLDELSLTKSAVILTGDCAVLQHPPKPTRVKQMMSEIGVTKGNNPLIGISLQHPDYGFYQSVEEFRKIIASVADYLVRKLNAIVVFIPQGYGFLRDVPFIREVISLMHFKNRAKVIPEHYASNEMHGILGEMDLIISARYHPLVLAATECVPIIAIVYQHKTLGFMKMLDLEDFCLRIETINYYKLVSKINKAWLMRDEIKRTLVQKNKNLKKQTALNAKLAVWILRKSKIKDKRTNFLWDLIDSAHSFIFLIIIPVFHVLHLVRLGSVNSSGLALKNCKNAISESKGTTLQKAMEQTGLTIEPIVKADAGAIYILDIGSGDHPRLNATHLCDLYANSNAERSGPLRTDGKPFVRCTVEFLPFRDNSFIFDYACHVLEHTNSPTTALSEISRVAQRGYIETPTRLAERVYGWGFHKWVVYFKQGQLFFTRRKNVQNKNKINIHALYARNFIVRLLDSLFDYLLGWHCLRVVWKKDASKIIFEKINVKNRHRYRHLINGNCTEFSI